MLYQTNQFRQYGHNLMLNMKLYHIMKLILTVPKIVLYSYDNETFTVLNLHSIFC